jgi:uncharacterized protein YcfL
MKKLILLALVSIVLAGCAAEGGVRFYGYNDSATHTSV